MADLAGQIRERLHGWHDLDETTAALLAVLDLLADPPWNGDTREPDWETVVDRMLQVIAAKLGIEAATDG